MTTPRPTTLCGQLEAFFARNPDEVLTLADICTKWDINRRQATAAVRTVAKRGRLRVVAGMVMGLQA